MKKLIIIFTLVGFHLSSFAQNDTIPAIQDTIPPIQSDTIDLGEMDEKDLQFRTEIGDSDDSKKVKTRWLMLDYGISTYLHDGSLNMPIALEPLDQKLLGSNNWQLHLVKQRVSLTKKNRVNLTYGLTLDFDRYRFSNDFTLAPETSIVSFDANPGVDFKKSQLNTTYLNAPFLLGFRLKPKNTRKSFNIKVGGYAGILLSSKTKQKISGEKKIRVKDDFNLNKVQYGLTARAGFGIMDVYVNYGLNSLFKEDVQGLYEVQPISFGISIIPF